MEQKYTISILLTKYEDFTSKLVYYLTGKGYTHASIGLDETKDEYYSFNIKGFRRERPLKHKDIITDSICYKLEVSKEEYEKVVELINAFQENRFEWKYSTLGVILCVLQIPHKRAKHYFCTQFVAEVLQKARIAELKLHASLYNPNNLERELRNLFNLERVVMNPI